MENREIAEAVCRMASDFYRLRNRSILDLLKSSGYIQGHDAITEQLLQDIFEASPDLIHPWLVLSEDQRTKYGYYLSPRRTGWVVGYHPGGNEERFPEGPAACARFVKLEAENLRYMIEGGPPIKTRGSDRSRKL
ncbi:MAG TPA: hypothetical protein VK752_14370 [Bryobacteraceae bacterium]|nr:hypothetical protein [Bryobacteraceae bacterium]